MHLSVAGFVFENTGSGGVVVHTSPTDREVFGFCTLYIRMLLPRMPLLRLRRLLLLQLLLLRLLLISELPGSNQTPKWGLNGGVLMD